MRKVILALVLSAIALLAQTPAPVPAFEVVSIKPAPPLNPADVAAGKLHVGMNIDGARVDIGFLSLADLIPIAYRVKRYQVSGPDWMSAQRFDVLGKIPEGVSKDQVPEMLQAMLADRFKLAIHRESKEHSVYALVVGKNGLKLKEAPPETAPPSADIADADKDKGISVGGGTQMRFNRDGSGAVVSGGPAGKMRVTMGQGGMMHFEAERMTLAGLADMLAPFLDRPVQNMTELKGNYQISLDIAMSELLNVAKTAGLAIPGAAPSARADVGSQPANAASEPSGSSIFNSVQQLGIKLESRKAPVETIIIDHLEKAPTEN